MPPSQRSFSSVCSCPAISAETAERGPRWADGLVTINQAPEKLTEMLRRWEDAGGADHRILQIHLCWAPTQEQAWSIAQDQWRSNVFPPPANTDLRVVDYEAVSADGVSREQLERSVIIGSDLGELTQRIQDLSDLGFDAVYLHHVRQDQRPFLEAFGERVLPHLH